MTVRTFSSDAEAIQYALDELAKVSEVVVELRGMIEGHRSALQVLAFVLEHEGSMSRETVAKMTAAAAGVVEKIAARHPENPTTQLQYGSATRELRLLSDIYADEAAPIFTVIQGGKED